MNTNVDMMIKSGREAGAGDDLPLVNTVYDAISPE